MIVNQVYTRQKFDIKVGKIINFGKDRGSYQKIENNEFLLELKKSGSIFGWLGEKKIPNLVGEY